MRFLSSWGYTLFLFGKTNCLNFLQNFFVWLKQKAWSLGSGSFPALGSQAGCTWGGDGLGELSWVWDML